MENTNFRGELWLGTHRRIGPDTQRLRNDTDCGGGEGGLPTILAGTRWGNIGIAGYLGVTEHLRCDGAHARTATRRVTITGIIRMIRTSRIKNIESPIGCCEDVRDRNAMVRVIHIGHTRDYDAHRREDSEPTSSRAELNRHDLLLSGSSRSNVSGPPHRPSI